jgi:CheY-like chemotaxis protein
MTSSRRQDVAFLASRAPLPALIMLAATTAPPVAVAWYPRCSRAGERMMVDEPRPASVLVIDDDPDLRRLLSDFLVRGGYHVVEASNGDDAFFLVESERIDVVVLDKEMPGMNGLDVLSLLRQRCPSLPIIFITAFGGRDVAEECRRRGAWHYIEKPFRVAAIVDTVQAVLDRPTA